MRIEVIDSVFAGLFHDYKETTLEREQSMELLKHTKANIALFLARVKKNIFTREYALYYDILSKLYAAGSAIITCEQLVMLAESNKDRIIKSPIINLKAMDPTGDLDNATLLEGFMVQTVETYKFLSDKFVTADEFQISLHLLLEEYTTDLTMQTVTELYAVMHDGLKVGKKEYIGIEGFKKLNALRMQEIAAIESLGRNTTYQWTQENVDKDREKNKKMEPIMSTGLKEIDDVIGPLYKTNMWGVLGPPKGGKSTFSAFLCYKAIKAGRNVCIWPVEGLKEEWMAKIRALHCFVKYGKYIDSNSIRMESYAPELHQILEASYIDLLNNPEYGRFMFKEGSLYLETFENEIIASYNSDPFDVIVVDYLGCMLSTDKGKSKHERISEGFLALKNLIANVLNIGAIVPIQLKQTVVEQLLSNPDDTIDVTDAADSAEAIRTPDNVIGLFSTKDMRDKGQMKFSHAATRHSRQFKDFYAHCNLGVSFFASDPTLNVAVGLGT